MLELRAYKCPDCGYQFWVNCDDADYSCYCPFCGEDHGAEGAGGFFKSPMTVEVRGAESFDEGI